MSKLMKTLTLAALLAMPVATTMTMTGCEDEGEVELEENGVIEETGEGLENTGEELGEGVEDITE